MAANVTEDVLALGDGVSVTRRQEGARLTLVVSVKTGAECVLHWGLMSRGAGAWEEPPQAVWPPDTTPATGQAVRTPLALNARGERELTIRLDLPSPWKKLPFVVHFPQENRWLKSSANDFIIPIPSGRGPASPEAALATWAPAPSAKRQASPLDNGARLAAATWSTADALHVALACDADAPLALHWGLVGRFRHEWLLPPEELRPADTTVFDDKAVRTPFVERDGMPYLELNFPRPAAASGPRGMRFVIYQPDGNVWLKSGGQDLSLPLFEAPPDPRLPTPQLVDLAEQIVGAEMGAGSWTLMHRFNLCHDLLEGAEHDEDALALLFVWLRYSATRQLDWQRRFNTKPRELSHAQDRLTGRLAGLWRRSEAGPRLWARLMLTTLGRGGEGQRVRDEILHIMHRNHIKEMHGHFIEEWHQKLHNNTTPDDVVICAGYLAFLRSNGDVGRFYRTLEEGGVTRERLQNFERPIRSDPEFYADRKEALIGEFEHFLRILKSVHSGTDLDSAAGAARGRLDAGLSGKLDAVLGLRQKGAAADLAAAVVALREGLRGALAAAKDDAAVRDLLFLDLALEELLRAAIERQTLSRLGRDELARLAQLAMQNIGLSVDAPELTLCAGHWVAVLGMRREGRDWALHAKSVAERAARWVASFTDDVYRRLQPRAELLGTAFEADPWTIPVFSEEVIRGGPGFALSLLLRHLDPLLRKQAGLGGWQVISPGAAFGRVRLTDRLLAVQEERFAEATVLVADGIDGSEEIPEGVTAVLTEDTPDVVSHVAVRARNAHVLFATCYEPETYGRLKELKEKTVALRVTPGGDVEYGEGSAATANGEAVRSGERPAPPPRAPRKFPGWVLTQDQFTPEVVGGKSNNLNGLRGRLPDWIHLPTSIALPFGVFERALADGANHEARARYDALLATVEQDPAGVLARIRALLLELTAPAELREALLATWHRVGLPVTAWKQIWKGVCRVWASKWNERAYLSRRARASRTIAC